MLERDFAAWIDHRDAAALARVFDGTAGRLLLVAVHLAGPGAQAEDLVQATFLHAMEGAWDRARPLWPWLAAILHNEARMAWRRRQRRREVGIDDANAAASREPDPAERALHGEAAEAVVAAIDALPLPYRQVLRLRLQHGLSPLEIARALEVPVGTVRSQLHRGLEQLRGALPAGLAVAAMACLVGEEALLAQVKVNVLAHGKAMAMAATAGAVGAWSWLAAMGWWSIKGKLLAGAALAALLLGGTLWLVGGPSERASAPAGPIAAAAAAGADASAPLPSTTPVPQQRTLAAAAEATEWPLVATVSHGSAPLPGVEVRVWVAARGAPEGVRQGDLLREDIAHGVTAADGTFRCALDALRARSELFRAARFVWVSAQQAGRGSDQTLLELPAGNGPHAFAAALSLGARGGVVGRVVDAAGAPVAFAEVRPFLRGRQPDIAQTTSDDGTFTVSTIGGELWPDQLVVHEAAHGLALVAVPPATAPREPGAIVDVGDVMLVARDVVRGRVVLGDGLPLGEYPVWLVAIDADTAADHGIIERFLNEPDGNNRGPIELRDVVAVPTVVRARTAPDGSFAFAGLERERPYAIAVRDSAMQFAWITARAGDGGVELRVERQLLRIDVRDAAGTALAGVALRADGQAGDRAMAGKTFRPMVGNAFFAADDAGRYVLLSPFDWSWTIAVSDPNAQMDTLTHEAVVGVHRADRSLVLRGEQRFGAMHVVAVDEAGVPLPNYGVRLHCLDRPLEQSHERMVPPPGGLRVDLPAGRWHVDVWLGKEVVYDWFLQMYARGRHEEDVVIAPGETKELRVVAPPAGMVAFALDSDTLPPEGVWPGLQIVDQATGAAVAVIAHRDFMPGKPRVDRPHQPLCDALLIAQQAFAPGPRAFVVSARGYRSERCDVEVAADTLTRCRLRLIRQN